MEYPDFKNLIDALVARPKETEWIEFKDIKVLNVPPLRFPEFSGDWKMVSLQDISTINPKSAPLQNTFIYIDLEAVEKGELRKIQEIMREEAPSRAQRVIVNNDILFQCVRPYQKNNYIHRILNTSNQQWVASTGYAQIRTITKLYLSSIKYRWIQ